MCIRDSSKLENERDEARAEAEGFKGLKAEFEAYKAEQAKEKAEAALKAAGCIDTVAASARLGEFEGDVEKLKGAAPYLFASSDKSKSTGGNPKGTPDPEDERTDVYKRQSHTQRPCSSHRSWRGVSAEFDTRR